MHPGSAPGGPEALVNAIVLMHRYSRDLTEIVTECLGPDAAENRYSQILLAIHRLGPQTPTRLCRQLQAPRSTLSRGVTRLESAGLVTRVADPRDGRSIRIALTARGRRKLARLSHRVGDYFNASEPLVKESFLLLDEILPSRDPHRPVDPLLAMERLSSAGAAYVEEVRQITASFRCSDELPDRFTLTLLRMCGTQRPTQIADELRMTPSGTSGVLSRLETAGLVTRHHDLTPGDRRAVVVALTPRGDEAVDALLAVFARHLPRITEALTRTWQPVA